MNVNATIFVQMINFFIVYYLLRVLLFKPALSVIDKELAELATLRGIISQQKKSIEIQERERHRSLYDCQEYFKSHRPDLFLHRTVVNQSDATVSQNSFLPLSQEEIADLASVVRKDLEVKIKHVH